MFDYPSEVLTQIAGYYGQVIYMGPSVIKSLTFYTNKRMYGPFGDEQGIHFTAKMKEGRVVGIHGKRGLFLDSLGVHVAEGKVITPVTTSPCKAVIPREPSVAEIDSPQLPAKLVLAKRAPSEEVLIIIIHVLLSIASEEELMNRSCVQILKSYKNF